MERDEIIRMWQENSVDFEAIASSVPEHRRYVDMLQINGEIFAPPVLAMFADLVGELNTYYQSRPRVGPPWMIYRGTWGLSARRELTFDELIEAAADIEYYRLLSEKHKAAESYVAPSDFVAPRHSDGTPVMSTDFPGTPFGIGDTFTIMTEEEAAREQAIND